MMKETGKGVQKVIHETAERCNKSAWPKKVPAVSSHWSSLLSGFLGTELVLHLATLQTHGMHLSLPCHNESRMENLQVLHSLTSQCLVPLL